MDIRESLELLGRISNEMGSAALLQEVRLAAKRIEEGRFYVVCLGQFKRGKSTLLNALVGESILPSGVPPVTSVATVLSHGSHRSARVLKAAEQDWLEVDPQLLSDFITEQGNSQNHREIVAVELLLPNPMLEFGLCLVDTPGLGSTLEGNTLETKAFLPRVDVVLLVTGLDPPLTHDELEILNATTASCEDVFIVLNKSDKLSEEERAQGRRYMEELLTEKLPDATIEFFEVSGLRALQGEPTADFWALRNRLRALATSAGRALSEKGASRGVHRIAGLLLREIELERDALLDPGIRQNEKIARLSKALKEAGKSSNELSFRFQAELEAAHKRFQEMRENFLETAPSKLEHTLAAAVQTLETAKLREKLVAQTRLEVKELTRDWLRRLEPVVASDFQAMVERLQEDCHHFLDSLSLDERETLELEPVDPTPNLVESRYYGVELLLMHTPSWWVAVSDRWRTFENLRESVLGSCHRQGTHLLEMNSTRVVVDLKERLQETRRGLERAIKTHLEMVIDGMQRASSRARLTREQGNSAVSKRVEQLKEWESLIRPHASKLESP